MHNVVFLTSFVTRLPECHFDHSVSQITVTLLFCVLWDLLVSPPLIGTLLCLWVLEYKGCLRGKESFNRLKIPPKKTIALIQKETGCLGNTASFLCLDKPHLPRSEWATGSALQFMHERSASLCN